MSEQEIIEKMKSEGYQKVYVWNAQPGEVDEEHQHDFDARLIVLNGQIQITSLINGVITNMSFQYGANIDIEKNTPHSAKVGPNGCPYIVGEKPHLFMLQFIRNNL